MKKSKETKRKDFDRAYAAELVRRYREKDPYREPIGPGGPIVETAVDGDFLAMELQHFVAFGTWGDNAERIKVRALSMRGFLRAHVEELRQGRAMWKVDPMPKTALERFEEVAGHFGVDVQTVKDAVYPRRSKPRKRKS